MKDSAARLISMAAHLLRGVKITALVGTSGTGKTFRARLIAERRGIDLIVDDGLIIDGSAILSGHWAKKEKAIVSAVRSALFAERSRAEEARKTLRDRPFRSILIVGTSVEMTEKIAHNLWLPPPSEVIRVEEVATRTEIEAAARRRGLQSGHASPVPLVRMRKGPLRSIIDAVRSAWRGAGGSPRIEAPAADRGGTVFFSTAAASQMVLHCIREFAPDIEMTGVSFREEGGMLKITLTIRLPRDSGPAGRLYDLRDFIIRSMERHAGMLVSEVSLIVEEVTPPQGSVP